jgi:glycosyltransferase involved in cell wall biosynthesis
MKRILYIHHGGGIGGAPLSLLFLLQQLDRTRYEPVVVTLKSGPVVELYRAEGIETHVEPGISDFSHTTLEWYGGRDLWRLPGKLLSIPFSIRRTRALIQRLKPDLVHLNSSTLAPAAIACTREGVPVVWHIREPLARGYIGLRRWWLRQMIHRHATRVIAICQHDADQLIPSQRIRVIYNFVDFAHFDRFLDGSEVRAELGIAPQAPVVLMLGGVAQPKGTLILIKALPFLLAKLPEARVIVAGPPLEEAVYSGLKGLAKRALGVDRYHQQVRYVLDSFDTATRSALILTGIRQDIPRLIAASDCVVFPSVVPHFARPLVEAAAMAKAGVASDLGGPRELIVPGETGLLVPAGEPAALAEALAEVLSKPATAHAMGERAYRRARELFDARKNAAATITVYDEIMGLG